MPILSHVLLRANEKGLELEATNLEIGWKSRIGAKVESPGELTVPVRTFLELIGNIGSGVVTLQADEEVLKIESAGIRAQLNGLSVDEFPALPVFDASKAVDLDAAALRTAFEYVVFAAATDESRPVLTAILVRLSNGNLELVGTDGFRLSVAKLKGDTEGDDHEWLVPAKSVLELQRLIDEDVEKIRLATIENGNQVVFEIGDTELSSRLVSGTYPDFKKIMPDGGATKLVMNTADLLRAMKLAAVFARESANIVKFNALSSGSLMVSANAAAVGENEVEVDAEVSGPGGQIAFNYRYILDLLNVVSSKEISFEMNEPLDAGLWTVKSTNFVHVIMPVRLEDE